MNARILTHAQTEAVAQADAYLSDAGLPTYTDLLAGLDAASAVLDLTLPLMAPVMRQAVQ